MLLRREWYGHCMRLTDSKTSNIPSSRTIHYVGQRMHVFEIAHTCNSFQVRQRLSLAKTLNPLGKAGIHAQCGLSPGRHTCLVKSAARLLLPLELRPLATNVAHSNCEIAVRFHHFIEHFLVEKKVWPKQI